MINYTEAAMGFTMIRVRVRSGAGLEMDRHIVPPTKVPQKDPTLLVQLGGGQRTTTWI